MKRYGLYFAWFISLIATFGSLFFEESGGHEPCSMCWYQRMLLFPLIVILGIAAFRNAFKIITYVLPLTLLGLGLALYQIGAVDLGLTCKDCLISKIPLHPYLLPLLSLGAFALMNTVLIWTALLNRKSKKL